MKVWVRFSHCRLLTFFIAGAGFDGIYFDVLPSQECSCTKCARAVQDSGGNPENYRDCCRFGQKLIARFREELYTHVRRTFLTARYT